MTKVYAADELVDLLEVSRPFADAELVSVKIDTMPLDQATATVVEGWGGNEFQQKNAMIVRRSGQSIWSFEEIKRLYQLRSCEVAHALKISLFGIVSFI